MMTVIENLKPDLNEMGWLEGRFLSKSLFSGLMNVTIFDDDEASIQYAERCIEDYNSLQDIPTLLCDLQNRLAKYMLYMYDEWREMGIYDNIVTQIEPMIQGYQSGKNLIQYLTNPTLYIEKPDNHEIGYCLEADCPWEPEHQCLIIIREHVIKYVGPSQGNTPWDDEEEYYCIWNDQEEVDAPREYRFYGWDSADVPILVNDFPSIHNPKDLYDALSSIWCAETCAPRMRDQWTETNRTLGQCSITAFLVQDLFGGKVYGILRPGGNYHCYNDVNGHIFDLTSEQFGDEVLQYENQPEQFREDHFSKEEKRSRYEYLKKELMRKYGSC